MLRLIYQSLMNKKVKTLLLLFQFTIGFIALTFGLGLMNHVMQYKKCVGKIVPLESVHAYIDEQDEPAEYNSKLVNKYRQLFEQVKNEGLVKQVGLFELLHIYTESEDQTDKLYVLNQDSLAMQDFDLQKGSIHELLHYGDGQTIPIIISDDMQSVYECGKTYNFSYNDVKGEEKTFMAKIVGVLSPDNRYWVGGASSISENVLGNKSFMIAPQFIEYQEELTYMYNAILNPIQDSHTLDRVAQIFSENKLDIEFMSLKEETEKYYETQKTIVTGMLVFAGILLFLSLLGSVGAILTGISTRYREFGIYYSLGADKCIIVRMVLGEIFLILTLAFLLSAGISFVFYKTILSEVFRMDVAVTGVVFAIMLLCAILCSIMPFIKMKQIEPVELMKGMD